MYIKPFRLYALRRNICNSIDQVERLRGYLIREALGIHTNCDQDHHDALGISGPDSSRRFGRTLSTDYVGALTVDCTSTLTSSVANHTYHIFGALLTALKIKPHLATYTRHLSVPAGFPHHDWYLPILRCEATSHTRRSGQPSVIEMLFFVNRRASQPPS
ncbi:hypothetical protein BDM02DRAFT_3113888 [Thelephora ganbajun]|uniref:Uncharacterized protein n=1 Tax=Thelephora ganbajun TaxID=370292 RepID=A0ACB6ZIN4_THEGA|nr:hypothetical protein BDM02DRAFT_3113888 [Thelephora ganbajun]